MPRRHPAFTLRLALVSLALVAVAACAPTTPTGQPAWFGAHLTGWAPRSSYTVDSLTSAQGVATVNPTGAAPYVVYDNFGWIPQYRIDAGWSHVGDPDAHAGYVVYPYQAETSSLGKLYEVVTPTGQHVDYTHTLVPGEGISNSFATISPDGQWLVTGEWGNMTRLLVLPNPLLNPSTSPTGGALPLVGTINLTSTVSDLQGCDFVSSTRLVCSSDNSVKSLEQIDLASALSGGSVSGTVTRLGLLPQVSACAATPADGFETEGIDVDPVTGVLSVIMVPPGVCKVTSDVYQYAPA